MILNEVIRLSTSSCIAVLAIGCLTIVPIILLNLYRYEEISASQMNSYMRSTILVGVIGFFVYALLIVKGL